MCKLPGFVSLLVGRVLVLRNQASRGTVLAMGKDSLSRVNLRLWWFRTSCLHIAAGAAGSKKMALSLQPLLRNVAYDSASTEIQWARP